MKPAQPTLLDHIHELRLRFLLSAVVFAAGAALGYVFRGPVILFLQRPLHESLYYTTPMGSFEFVMQICGVVGLLVALPVIIYNLLRFIEPALSRQLSTRLLVGVVGLSFALAVAGAGFAYYVSLPAALHFFGSVGTSHLQPLISVDQYFRFVFAYLATFALVFQLPLILLLADHVTPLGPRGLRKWRKLVVVLAFAVALVSPSAPDPLSQVILALPIILLYEASLAIIWVRAACRGSTRARVEQTVPSRPVVARATTAVQTRVVALDLRPRAHSAVATPRIDLRSL